MQVPVKKTPCIARYTLNQGKSTLARDSFTLIFLAPTSDVADKPKWAADVEAGEKTRDSHCIRGWKYGLNSNFPKPRKSGLGENYISVHFQVPEKILILLVSELGLSDQIPLISNMRVDLNSRRH